MESASNAYIEIARRVRDASSGKLAELITLSVDPNLQLSEEEKNQPLMPFDHVFIRKSPGFERELLVTVQGEVNYPGEFAISSANERISDVVKRAGGLNQFAYPKGASLVRRTIYYKELTPEQIKEKTMRDIREKVDPETKSQLNQAELILFERLDSKISAIEEQKLIEEQRRILQGFDENKNADSLGRDSLFNNLRIKQQDVIGINLEVILRNPGTG